MKKSLIALSVLIIALMAYTDVKDRFQQLDKIADQTEVQKNIKSQPETSQGAGIHSKINKAIERPIERNIQNSGQNFNQGPTGFKENRIVPQTTTASPITNPKGVPQGESLQQQTNDNDF